MNARPHYDVHRATDPPQKFFAEQRGLGIHPDCPGLPGRYQVLTFTSQPPHSSAAGSRYITSGAVRTTFWLHTGILFTIGTADTETFDDGRIAVLDLKTGQKKILIEGGSCPRYSASGHLLYARAGKLLAVPFDVGRLAVTGQPLPVLDGVFMSRTTGMAAYSISNRGDLAYAPGPVEGGHRLPIWVDRQGHATAFNLPQRCYLHPRLSPDDKQLAVEIEGTTHDVFDYDLARGVLTRLSMDGASHWPLWTPKGDRITFRSWKTGGMTMWWMPADRSGPEEMLPGEGQLCSCRKHF